MAKRLVGVAVVAAPGHVVGGEQHLAGDDAVAGELLGVAVHQQPLADRGGGLLGRQGARPPGQAERRQPGGDRTGGDQHDLDAARAGRREDVDQPAYALGVDAALGGGERRRADLDHDAAGRGDLLGAAVSVPLIAPTSSSTRSGSSSEPIS